ncbi:MAG: hypothetical protein ABIB98_00565 [bacterium]
MSNQNLEMRALILKKYKYNKNSFVERRLPSEGTISVKVGDIVKSFSKVGECLYCDKSQEMVFEGELIKKEGEKVFANETIWVLKRGVFKVKEGKASFSGIIGNVDLDKKTYTVTRPQRDYNLIAGVSGKIKAVVEGRGVLVETAAISVEGVFGRGKDVSGELAVLGDYKDVGDDEINKSHTDKILVCGVLSSYLYSKAKLFGVLGFVCGGVDYELSKSLQGDLSLIVTSGFGQLPMDPLLFDYLKGIVTRFVVMRPSISQFLIPEEQSLSWTNGVEGVYGDIKEDQIVQIFCHHYYGLTGTVVGFDKNRVKIEVWEEGKIIKLLPESIGIVSDKY